MEDEIYTFPEITFVGMLYCPHCGKNLFSWDHGLVSKCPHLIYAYAWGETDMFLAVRPEFARSFIVELVNSPSYQKNVTEDELEPISEKDQESFCDAGFSPEDTVALSVAQHCERFPEKLFPDLFSQSTIIFKDDGYHSGVHIVIGLGTPDERKEA